ncbi:MAG: polyphosphate kinase 2 family protein, partial [Acidimicrobiia bacterium]|nr:polyphosphate kinase 2 family protein [Acidimicrobiia bacterium]
MTTLVEQLRVTPGKQAGLADRDPRDTLGLDGKDAASDLLERLSKDLEALHGRLWAEGSRSVLLVLQGMDASGKDGTIRRVLSGLNPQGCQVASFKAPSDGELAHDYLWRVHPHVPGSGEISIFDRSHYEQVLVVRVHDLEPKERWERHYDQINAFEKLLVDEGTTILKF